MKGLFVALRLKMSLPLYMKLRNFVGIAPDSKHATEQKENMEQEQKMVKEALISAYDKNISARLKAELCSLEANNYNYTKDASASKSPSFPGPLNTISVLKSFFFFYFFVGLCILISPSKSGYDKKPEQWCTSWWYQFTVLLQRGLRERRFEAFNRLRIFQVISVAVLGGLLWWHTPTSHIEDRVRIHFQQVCC